MIVLTDAQWLCIRSFLYACSGIYAGNETRCRLFMAYLQSDPDRSAGLRDSTVVSAAGARPNKGAETALGRSRGSFSTQIHLLADRRARPLRLRVTGGQRHPGPGPGGSLDGRTVALLIADLGRRRLPRVAGDAGHRGRPSGPAGAHEPPTPRPGTVPGAQGRGTGPRRAQGVAARGHPLRPIRPALPGFSVLGRSLDLAAILPPHDLRSGRLAAPDGLPAGRAGTVRGAAGQLRSCART